MQLFNRVTCGSLENMAYHISHPSKQDQFLGAECCQPLEIHQEIQAMYSNAFVSKTTVKD
jgi:hypothetical protein